MKERLKAGYEIATGALALFAVSLAVLDVTRGLNQWQRVADNIVLAVFIIDYIVRLFASGNKRDFVKHNIFDLIAIIPFISFQGFQNCAPRQIGENSKNFKSFEVGSL